MEDKGEEAHLVAPPEVGVLHERPVPQFPLEEFVGLWVQDVLQQNVHVVQVLVGDLLNRGGNMVTQ